MRNEEMITIETLLMALQNPDTPSGTGTLENNSDTWRRIGEKDRFDELGLTGGELSDFLTEWTAANPYNSL